MEHSFIQTHALVHPRSLIVPPETHLVFMKVGTLPPPLSSRLIDVRFQARPLP